MDTLAHVNRRHLHESLLILLMCTCAIAQQISAQDVCPPLQCNSECHLYGYKKNANGCEICECKDPPTVFAGCPRDRCTMECYFGYVLDENGCNTCMCKVGWTSSDRCPTLDCSLNCAAGWRFDKNGCKMCECMATTTVTETPSDCEDLACHAGENCNHTHPIPCINTAGFEVTCSFRACSLTCTEGYEHDADGCPLCHCKQSDLMSQCAKISCPLKTKCVAEDVMCVTQPCPVKATCVPIQGAGCPPFKCTMQCPMGFKRDAKDCVICECERCPSISGCTTKCVDGFEVDANGCELCQCRPHKDQCQHVYFLEDCGNEWLFINDDDNCIMTDCEGSSHLVCAEHPGATTPPCHLDCLQYGHAQDEYGCNLCECLPPPPQTFCDEAQHSCAFDCHFGYKIDAARSCFKCECKLPPANDVYVSCYHERCATTCPDGVRITIDAHFCPHCECRKPTARQCAMPDCYDNYATYCWYGLKLDTDGCSTCECREGPTCPAYNCRVQCERGYKTELMTACNLCECSDEQETPKPIDYCQDNTCPAGSSCLQIDGCTSHRCEIAPKITCYNNITDEYHKTCENSAISDIKWREMSFIVNHSHPSIDLEKLKSILLKQLSATMRIAQKEIVNMEVRVMTTYKLKIIFRVNDNPAGISAVRAIPELAKMIRRRNFVVQYLEKQFIPIPSSVRIKHYDICDPSSVSVPSPTSASTALNKIVTWGSELGSKVHGMLGKNFLSVNVSIGFGVILIVIVVVIMCAWLCKTKQSRRRRTTRWVATDPCRPCVPCVPVVPINCTYQC